MLSLESLCPRPVWIAVLVTASVFVIDLVLPVGVALGVLYLVPILFLQGSSHQQVSLWVAVIGTGLTMLGYILKIPPGAGWLPLTNRVLSIAAIWLTVAVVSQRKGVQARQHQAEDTLQRNQEELRALAANLFLVQEEERRRVSRELHDDLNQELAALGVEVAKLNRQLSTSPTPIQEQLAQLRERLEKVADNVRNMAYQLHPAILDYLGLVAALESECRTFSARSGISVTYTHQHVPATLPEDLSLCLYRVTQECLRNIAKHAQVERVALTLEGNSKDLRLRIEDSGSFFDPAQMKGKRGLGLVSMEERVRLVNGTFLITARPGGGMRVEVVVPLSQRELYDEKSTPIAG